MRDACALDHPGALQLDWLRLVEQPDTIPESAHACPPFMAEGACLAREDAIVLADCQAGGAVSKALSTYEARRRPRSDLVQAVVARTVDSLANVSGVAERADLFRSMDPSDSWRSSPLDGALVIDDSWRVVRKRGLKEFPDDPRFRYLSILGHPSDDEVILMRGESCRRFMRTHSCFGARSTPRRRQHGHGGVVPRRGRCVACSRRQPVGRYTLRSRGRSWVPESRV